MIILALLFLTVRRLHNSLAFSHFFFPILFRTCMKLFNLFSEKAEAGGRAKSKERTLVLMFKQARTCSQFFDMTMRHTPGHLLVYTSGCRRDHPGRTVSLRSLRTASSGRTVSLRNLRTASCMCISVLKTTCHKTIHSVLNNHFKRIFTPKIEF